MLNVEFKIEPKDWKIVSEVGYPKDMRECMALFRVENDDKYHFMIASYSKEEKEFYVDYGWGGGLVLDQEDAYAWSYITPKQLKELKK